MSDHKRINPEQDGAQVASADRSARALLHDVEQQSLRILRCTAQALASSLGGLRFTPDSQPWLQGWSAVLEQAAQPGGRNFSQPAGVRHE